jgi:hypothetical protein
MHGRALLTLTAAETWHHEYMRDDARQQAVEFLRELFATGDIDASQFDAGLSLLFAARTEAEIAGVIRSLPVAVAIPDPRRPRAEPLQIHSGIGRLRLSGRWQVASKTHVSAGLGSVTLDLTAAEFADRVIDLHVYTGMGSITIVVPRGVGVQVVKHRGGVDSRLYTPVPGLPLIRLDVATNIGRVHLRYRAATVALHRERRARRRGTVP